MTGNQRTFDTGVAQSIARLPDPPRYWSYSSLKEVETCPRRYVLGHALFPDLWDGIGYPQLPYQAALFGSVVHDSLARIIAALAQAGCFATNSPGAVSVLRELGGYSEVAREALGRRLRKMEGNPRVDADRLTRIQEQLEARIPEARTEIQGYLQRLVLVPRGDGLPAVRTLETANPAGPDSRRTMGPGSHPEAPLRADSLRLAGRVDLLTVSADLADIADHKTGAEDPSHFEQLRLYALLWDQDNVANPAHVPLARLVASYPTHDVAIPAPDKEELRGLAESTAVRVAAADHEVAADRPSATTGEHCKMCGVRSICHDYWQKAPIGQNLLPDDDWLDYDGVVGEQVGARSWQLRGWPKGSPGLLLRVALSGRALTSGQHLRLLNVRRDDDPEVQELAATFTASSEAFVVTTATA